MVLPEAEPKREHLAAVALRRRFRIENILWPGLRFRNLTRGGPVWFVEAMFPGYLFAKFVYSTQHRAVESFPGARGILRFGQRPRNSPGTPGCASVKGREHEEVVTVDHHTFFGQPVQLIEGPFRGLEVLVTPAVGGGVLEFLRDKWRWKFLREPYLQLLTGDPYKKTKWPSEKRTLCFPASRGPDAFAG